MIIPSVYDGQMSTMLAIGVWWSVVYETSNRCMMVSCLPQAADPGQARGPARLGKTNDFWTISLILSPVVTWRYQIFSYCAPWPYRKLKYSVNFSCSQQRFKCLSSGQNIINSLYQICSYFRKNDISVYDGQLSTYDIFVTYLCMMVSCRCFVCNNGKKTL